jgi:hypothetical protein
VGLGGLCRDGDRFNPIAKQAAAGGIGDRERSAPKLRGDRNAVPAGQTLRHGNRQTYRWVKRLGPVERQGYARTQVDLPRTRVLRADCHRPPKRYGRPYAPFTRSAGEPRSARLRCWRRPISHPNG